MKKILVLLSLSVLMVACCTNPTENAQIYDEEASVVGLDVSHHNGDVNFENWNNGRNVEFCFYKDNGRSPFCRFIGGSSLLQGQRSRTLCRFLPLFQAPTLWQKAIFVYESAIG